MGQNKEIWVFGEHRDGHIARVTLELLGKAAELCPRLRARVVSLLVGSGVDKLITDLSLYGAEKIYLVDAPRLEYYQSEAYASAVADLIKEHQPEIFLLGATDIGKDLAPRVAAKVDTGLTAHCVELKIEDHEGVPLLSQIVPGWGGEKMITIICPRKRPQMAAVKPGVFDLPARKTGGKAEIIKISPQLNDKHFRARTIEVREAKSSAVALAEAEVVVAAGWGVYSLGDLKLVEELAETVGGAVGGTRPVVDKGWITADRMIGQSGKIVSPRLFISLGASGAMHFTTGFGKSKFILAVEQNPQAPIFKVADVGIVGDLSEVLPCLIEEFKKLKRDKQ